MKTCNLLSYLQETWQFCLMTAFSNIYTVMHVVVPLITASLSLQQHCYVFGHDHYKDNGHFFHLSRDVRNARF